MTPRPARAPALLAGMRGRMLLALVATSLATLGAAALVVLPPLERRVERDRLDELRELARTIRPELRDVPARDRRRGSPALLHIAERVQRRAGGRILVYDSAGRELADTATAPAGGVPELGGIGDLSAAVRRRPAGVLAGERRGVAFAATVAGEPRPLTLVIAKRLDDSRAAIAVARAALPLAIGAGLAVALVLAFLLSRSVLRRLDRLRADAEALGTDGLGHRVAVSGGDEVAVVARALEDMRERLLEEQQSRQEFISTASHELRTPLSSLQATLELLKEEMERGAADPDRVAASADAALRQTGRLTTLATELLDISRVDGGAPLKLEPIEFGELAGTIGSEFTAPLAASGRSLRLLGGPALALADPGAAARIVRILLDNAVRYGAGTVTVSVGAGAGRVVLAIEDEGAGVADDERERIFRRFARGSAAAGSASGAGLGLPIARGLARAMGGDLSAEPVPTGARFVLTVPAA